MKKIHTYHVRQSARHIPEKSPAHLLCVAPCPLLQCAHGLYCHVGRCIVATATPRHHEINLCGQHCAGHQQLPLQDAQFGCTASWEVSRTVQVAAFPGRCPASPATRSEWTRTAQPITLREHFASIWFCWLQDGGTAGILLSGQTHGTAREHTSEALQGEDVRSAHQWYATMQLVCWSFLARMRKMTCMSPARCASGVLLSIGRRSIFEARANMHLGAQVRACWHPVCHPTSMAHDATTATIPVTAWPSSGS